MGKNLQAIKKSDLTYRKKNVIIIGGIRSISLHNIGKEGIIVDVFSNLI